MTSQSPRVFISYSHDSPAHMDRVLALTNHLRRDGVDAMIDRYEPAPPDGWPHWMSTQIESSDFVLMICTETYQRRVEKREVPGCGLGGAWEGQLIYSHFYRAGTVDARFLPVLFSSSDERFIPTIFASMPRFLADTNEGYEALYRHITAQPEVSKPQLGAARPLPSRSDSWRVRPEIRLLGVPPTPQLFLGREAEMAAFKRLLGVLPDNGSNVEPLRTAAITGLPGVGKSSFVSALPHDPDVQATYPDGILWTALGQSDHLRTELERALTDWAQDWDGSIGTDNHTLERAIDRWRVRLRHRRALVVVDDVWNRELVERLLGIVGEGCSFIITSRMPLIAEFLVPQAPNRFRLDVLDRESAVALLEAFSPDVVANHAAEAIRLAETLGNLPLALTVAGRLLGSSVAAVRGVEHLLEELQAGERLLRESPPADMVALSKETMPSVAALLHKSTSMLDEELRSRFAMLGAFQPDPATFDLEVVAAVWGVNDPEPIAEALVGHGLLEVLTNGRLRMHALVATLARSMLETMGVG